MAKQRINEILQEYWDSLKKGGEYPDESEVDPDALAEIWDHCFLVKVEHENIERPYEYVYLGESLIRAYGGDDVTEKDVAETLVYPSDKSLLHKFKEVVDSRQPVEEDSEFTNASDMVIKFRSNMLPLSHGGEEGVAFILGGMKWKAF